MTYTRDVYVTIDCRLNSTTEFGNASYDLERSEGLVTYRQQILVTAALKGDWFTCHVHVTSSPGAAMLAESRQQNCVAAQNFTTVWHSQPLMVIVTKDDESTSKSACLIV